MDRAYFVWIGVFAFGGVLGLLFKLRFLGIAIGCSLMVLVVGLLVGAATGSAALTWGSGIALMAAPLLGAILFAGAALSNVVVVASKRRGCYPPNAAEPAHATGQRSLAPAQVAATAPLSSEPSTVANGVSLALLRAEIELSKRMAIESHCPKCGGKLKAIRGDKANVFTLSCSCSACNREITVK